MAIASSSKGKKPVIERSRASSSSLSPVPDDIPKVTRRRRAETRQCPVCDEHIPLRLLATHTALESERVEVIISQVGSADLVFDHLDDRPGPSSRSRRSAIRARKSLNALVSGRSDPTEVLQQAAKIIQTIKRHRRQRHVKFREMCRDEEQSNGRGNRMEWRGVEIACPICRSTVRGDQDVVDAHVDACLANESRRLDEERERTLLEQRTHIWEEEYDMDSAAGHVGNVVGTGFHTRNVNDKDVDDELDVDGDEEFGEPQFTEGDILPTEISRPVMDQDMEVEIVCDSEDEERQKQTKTLRDLVVEGEGAGHSSYGIEPVGPKIERANTDKMSLAVLVARKHGNKSSLIAALEAKVEQLEATRMPASTSSLCRICLDPYNEPTISTGCWHTCCRECWLRCLGSTKLCPICKRITGATDLRRIYL